MTERTQVTVTVNGETRTGEAEPRLLLADFLRDELRLTGTHVGCEHGVCGACTVLLDGHSARSCLTLAVQADGLSVTTIEGLSNAEGTSDGIALGPLQQAFMDCHALQCGFCTPGMLSTLTEFLRDHANPTEQEVRLAISGNLCRCTGYENIVKAALQAADAMHRTSTDARKQEPGHA